MALFDFWVFFRISLLFVYFFEFIAEFWLCTNVGSVPLLGLFYFYMQSLDPVFFKSLLSNFLAFSRSLLEHFSFLICDNLIQSFPGFKSLPWLSIMHFFNYIFILWMSETQIINIESLINWLINLKYSSQTANFTHLIFWFCYTSGRYTIDNF